LVFMVGGLNLHGDFLGFICGECLGSHHRNHEDQYVDLLLYYG